MARFDEYFEAEVVRADAVTPGMIRVRFGGDELRGWRTSGDPDERLTIAFPASGSTKPPRPRISGGAWHIDHGPEPERRSYTVRAVGDNTLDVDFVVHEGGVASAWASAARPGDVVGLSLATGWYRRPADASTVLLVGDATALPAIGRILEEAPAGLRMHAIIEVASDEHRQELRSQADVTETWLIGSGMGRAPSALPGSVRAAVIPDHGVYVWVAAEAAATRAIRKHLRQDRGLPNSAISALGYWRADKESWIRRYEPAKPELARRRRALEDAGLTGQDLVEAWDQVMERAGL